MIEHLLDCAHTTSYPPSMLCYCAQTISKSSDLETIALTTIPPLPSRAHKTKSSTICPPLSSPLIGRRKKT